MSTARVALHVDIEYQTGERASKTFLPGPLLQRLSSFRHRDLTSPEVQAMALGQRDQFN